MLVVGCALDREAAHGDLCFVGKDNCHRAVKRYREEVAQGLLLRQTRSPLFSGSSALRVRSSNLVGKDDRAVERYREEVAQGLGTLGPRFRP